MERLNLFTDYATLTKENEEESIEMEHEKNATGSIDDKEEI